MPVGVMLKNVPRGTFSCAWFLEWDCSTWNILACWIVGVGLFHVEQLAVLGFGCEDFSTWNILAVLGFQSEDCSTWNILAVLDFWS